MTVAGETLLGKIGRVQGEILYEKSHWLLNRFNFIQMITTVLFILTVASALLSIILTFYIGRTRIKEIDKVVYGVDFPHDSIFASMMRVPNYGGAFFWKWSARWSGLEGKIEHFDYNFRWPFVVVFILMIFGGSCMIATILTDKYL